MPARTTPTTAAASPASPGESVPSTKGERTRARLKGAAVQELGRRGYHALRVSDVCKAAGVSQGTFYLYFENKHAITLEVFRDFIAEGQQAMRTASPHDDPFESILGATRVYVEILVERAPLARAMLQLADHDPDVAEMWQRTSHEWLTRIVHDLERRCDAPEVDDATRWFTAYAMNWMVDGFLHSLLLRHDLYMKDAVGGVDDLAEALSVLWYRAAYGENPPAAQLTTAHAVCALRLDRMPKATP